MGDNKNKALHYFIKETTVGELNYVLDDISSLIGNKDFLQEPEIIEALRNYHETHLTHHTLASGENVVVSDHGRQSQEESAKVADAEGEGEDQAPAEASHPSQFTYVDHARNIKFTLDVATGECKIVEGGASAADESAEAFKVSLTESLDKYVSEKYKENTTLGTVSVTGASDVEAHIDISCHNLNHKNFWGGEWISRWVVRHTLGSSEYELAGSIKINNHYFEQGNIQCKLDKTFEASSAAVKGDDAAQSIIAHIEKHENEYQATLEVMFEEIKENYMKSLRRKLPFTGKSFDWGAPKLM